MVRFLNVNIPDNKNIDIALSYVYGIGPSFARKILKKAGIDSFKKTKDLAPSDFNKIKEIIDSEKIKTEGDLRREIKSNIQRLISVGSYRGTRHIRHLPARGQRTKTNSRTTRGYTRKTVGSGRKKAPAPK
ncbi:MAG: 30S ribosomal protein S13 [Candidatus Paceibacterota bacterium]|jgi:small subunit ribosomal protein S13|nr:30S ribosomal protein S13 [Candidatus Paceibacterota bacterium]MDD3548423.1 30S ribosomal protein S13 [Candidatus Paceibacterota bacterium]MDD4999308.1 30S ribosomal protein S13 [Candidatus Paceibacterota bacterium]MDD5545362.1 30S ribosomal protein S13 [Candidatus Paceibacterota bacterium]